MDATSDALAESLAETPRNNGTMAAVLLAAGLSTRFGGHLKQLAKIDGETLVHRALRTVLETRQRLDVPLRIYLVLGHRADEVQRAVADLLEPETDLPRIQILLNHEHRQGQSTSVRHAARHVLDKAPDVESAFFLPVDQPAMDAATLERLVLAHRQGKGQIIVPRHQTRRGAPVLFDRVFFPQLADLTGDQGGRALIQQHPDAVDWLELHSSRPLDDIDTPEDLARWTSGTPSS